MVGLDVVRYARAVRVCSVELGRAQAVMAFLVETGCASDGYGSRVELCQDELCPEWAEKRESLWALPIFV